jgi:glycine dehydrogenase
MHATRKPSTTSPDTASPPSDFLRRHIALTSADIAKMLSACGATDLDTFTADIIPQEIPHNPPLPLPQPLDEAAALAELRKKLSCNKTYRSLIGMGYADCITPPVILRNVLKNPGWYTSYTPYQAEISQGRLEAMLNFQTLVTDLTAMDVANASLLDEATAAAEAVAMCHARKPAHLAPTVLIQKNVLPQTRSVVATRAELLGITITTTSELTPEEISTHKPFAILIAYPDAEGHITPLAEKIDAAHAIGAKAIIITDLLALTILPPPGRLGKNGADVVVGSAQRLGVPLGYGGPHAAFFATREEFKRLMPGRVVGVSRDADGRPAYRLSMQTREQHIRRDKATSNICTAQVLLANIAAFTAIYHGPRGLRRIALRIHTLARQLSRLTAHWKKPLHQNYFDTLCWQVTPEEKALIRARALKHRINLNYFFENKITLTLDEKTTPQEISLLAEILTGAPCPTTSADIRAAAEADAARLDPTLRPATDYLTHPVFNTHHSEHAMLRYLKQLENKDLSLTHSMIPLGSCTMKLNATAEMIPLTWDENGGLHPFCPSEQARGTRQIILELERWLGAITGLPAVSLQPNAGSQGELAGLLAIRRHHQARGQDHRRACLIPVSAHGTNPASAVMAGLRVVPVGCDDRGNISHADLSEKIAAHKNELAAIMITYPSTHGVFESGIRDICRAVHRAGGLVYMDGANMNAQVGLCRPADFGVDVCHLNLHKTFCIPHGGGGPGIGPICATNKLRPHLPGHPLIDNGSGHSNSIAAAPWGSASLLVIPWMYIRMMGAVGLRRATQCAILAANYIAARLGPAFPVLYTGKNGRVAHECILDLRPLKKTVGIDVEDVAKRLMDYGFHAPTMSWPVPGTLMIEPTESEPLVEIDRFCDAMLAIRAEIDDIARGALPPDDNPLKNAPHTAQHICSDTWTHPYSRQRAAYPLGKTAAKYWPPVRRIDNVWGDRNIICTCPGVEELANLQTETQSAVGRVAV